MIAALAAKPLMDMAGGAMDGGGGPSAATSTNKGGTGPVINFGGRGEPAGMALGANLQTGLLLLLVVGVVFVAVKAVG